MKKRVTLIFILLQVILVSMVSISYAKYTKGYSGKIGISVAKPISRVVIDGDVYISNYGQKPIYFSVYNYDEKGKISEIKMNYKIIIKTTQSNAPLKYKLYRVYSDKQEEIKINNSKGIISQVNAISMNAETKQTHNYKLEIMYDNASTIELDKNIGISITLQSVQAKI